MFHKKCIQEAVSRERTSTLLENIEETDLISSRTGSKYTQKVCYLHSGTLW